MSHNIDATRIFESTHHYHRLLYFHGKAEDILDRSVAFSGLNALTNILRYLELGNKTHLMSDIIFTAMMLMIPKMVCKQQEKLLQDKRLIIGLMKPENMLQHIMLFCPSLSLGIIGNH